MDPERPATESTAIVRDATPADVPGLQACYDQARHAERVARADGKACRYLVAEFGGQIVGFGSLVYEQSASRRPIRYLPWIANLNVREDMQSRGFGSLLIRAMERMAADAGHAAVYIGSNATNPRALALYQRLGFEIVEEPLAQPPEQPPDAQSGRKPTGGGVIYLRKFLPQPAAATRP